MLLPTVFFCLLISHHILNIPLLKPFKRKLTPPFLFLSLTPAPDIYRTYSKSTQRSNYHVSKSLKSINQPISCYIKYVLPSHLEKIYLRNDLEEQF